MIVIPAIDLRGGQCVRLVQGDFSKETVYSNDPVQVAQRWKKAGATRLHVVDLDGARSGHSANFDVIVAIKKETGLFVQTGGGLRTEGDVKRVLEAGIDRAILGTVIFENAPLAKAINTTFAGKIIAALDVKKGCVAIKGWVNRSDLFIMDAFRILEDLMIQDVIYTNIDLDGGLQGVNADDIAAIMRQTTLNVFASGGVKSIDDIMNLARIGSPGCIVGKSIYEGTLKLEDAFEAAKDHA